MSPVLAEHFLFMVV